MKLLWEGAEKHQSLAALFLFAAGCGIPLTQSEILCADWTSIVPILLVGIEI